MIISYIRNRGFSIEIINESDDEAISIPRRIDNTETALSLLIIDCSAQLWSQ